MNANTFSYAGFWRRFAAYVFDSVILGYFFNNIYWFIVNQMRLGFRGDVDSELISTFVIFPIFGIIAWCYFSGMESSPLQATVGKYLVGIYVTDSNGERISFGRATGRYFAKILSGIILSIGYLMAGFTEKKQALHDMVANSLVLKR
ncbi:RDD family protein [candidate division KSB1 bacterium]|nr:RDD family protein [candidate division KSB1 bacterium]